MGGVDIGALEREIENVLDAEKACLMKADFDGIEVISAKKEQLVERLGKITDHAPLRRIMKKIEWNGLLYEASLKGVRLAQQRIESIRTNNGQLKTYDGDGNISDKAISGRSLSLKA